MFRLEFEKGSTPMSHLKQSAELSKARACETLLNQYLSPISLLITIPITHQRPDHHSHPILIIIARPSWLQASRLDHRIIRSSISETSIEQFFLGGSTPPRSGCHRLPQAATGCHRLPNPLVETSIEQFFLGGSTPPRSGCHRPPQAATGCLTFWSKTPSKSMKINKNR